MIFTLWSIFGRNCETSKSGRGSKKPTIRNQGGEQECIGATVVVRALASHHVTRVQIPVYPGVGNICAWVEFVVGSLPCSERIFSGYSGFPYSSTTNILEFQINQESGR